MTLLPIHALVFVFCTVEYIDLTSELKTVLYTIESETEQSVVCDSKKQLKSPNCLFDRSTNQDVQLEKVVC